MKLKTVCHRGHADSVVDEDSKDLCLICHLRAATAKCYRVVYMNLTEGMRANLGSSGHQSRDDKYQHEQEGTLVTS